MFGNAEGLTDRSAFLEQSLLLSGPRDHTSDDLSVAHILTALVYLIKGVGAGDEFLDLQLTRTV
jgi:hypothetical protein